MYALGKLSVTDKNVEDEKGQAKIKQKICKKSLFIC